MLFDRHTPSAFVVYFYKCDFRGTGHTDIIIQFRFVCPRGNPQRKAVREGQRKAE